MTSATSTESPLAGTEEKLTSGFSVGVNRSCWEDGWSVGLKLDRIIKLGRGRLVDVSVAGRTTPDASRMLGTSSGLMNKESDGSGLLVNFVTGSENGTVGTVVVLTGDGMSRDAVPSSETGAELTIIEDCGADVTDNSRPVCGRLVGATLVGAMVELEMVGTTLGAIDGRVLIGILDGRKAVGLVGDGRTRIEPKVVDSWKVVDGRTAVEGRLVDGRTGVEGRLVDGRTVVVGRTVVDSRTVVNGRTVVEGKLVDGLTVVDGRTVVEGRLVDG